MAVRRIPELIAEHPFFGGLAPDHLQLIAGCGQNVHYAAGEMIFREGDPADTFLLLRRGDVALQVHAPPRGELIIQTLHAGDVLGFSGVFPPYRRHLDTRALTLARAISFDAACLRGKFAGDPRLGYELTQRFGRVLLERLRATRMQLLDVYGTA